MKRLRVRMLRSLAGYTRGDVLTPPEAVARAWIAEGIAAAVDETPAPECAAVRPPENAVIPAPERATAAPRRRRRKKGANDALA